MGQSSTQYMMSATPNGAAGMTGTGARIAGTVQQDDYPSTVGYVTVYTICGIFSV